MSPLYEYFCSCGEQFEAIVRYECSEKQPCPKCGNQVNKKEISQCSFHLKGNGWYSKDNPGKSAKKITKQNINELDKEQKLALVAQGLEQMTGKNLEEINDLDINKPKTEFNGEQI